jgi:hypothetical protein
MATLRSVLLCPVVLLLVEMRPALSQERVRSTLPLLMLMRPLSTLSCALLARRFLSTRSRPPTRGLRSKLLPGSARLLPSRRVLRPRLILVVLR